MRDLFRYRDLIWDLVARDLKVRYRRSFLGFIWSMLQPLMTMGVLMVVFSTIFRFDVRNYPVFALAGLLFWNFFQQSIVTSMNSLKSVAYILQKLPVPMAVFPIATILSGIVHLLFAMVPMLLVILLSGITLYRGGGNWAGSGWQWLLGTIGYTVPAIGLSLYLHYGYASDLNGMYSESVFPDELFRFLPIYTTVAGGIGFAIGWIAGRNV